MLRFLTVFLIFIISSDLACAAHKASHRPSYYYDPDIKWQAHVDMNLRGGKDRNIGRIDFMIPVLQDNTSMLFTDIRGMGDSHDVIEGNFGLGFRKIFNNRFILGTYAFYDRKLSESDIFFNQAVLGAEFLAEDFDLRANHYFNDGKTNYFADDPTSYTVQLTGNIVKLTSQGSRVYEERILGGQDVEIGMRNILLPWEYEGRLYMGYFHFKENLHPRVEGLRLRYEQKIRDWLFVEYETQEDQVRKHTSYGGVRLRYTFNKPKKKKPLSRIEQRMTTKIYRDIDAIRNARDMGEAPVTEVLAGIDGAGNALNGVATLYIIYYDNNATGSTGKGTKENPCLNFNCIKDQLAALGKGAKLYIEPGASVTVTSDLSLLEGQGIYGAGAPVTITRNIGTVVLIPQSTGTSTITVDASTSIAGIILGANGHVSGLKIDNPTTKHSIRVNDVSNTHIYNNTFTLVKSGSSSYAQSAIDLRATSTNTVSGHRIENNTITGNRKCVGILIDNQNTSKVTIDSIKGNTMKELIDGIYFNLPSSASAALTTVSNNTIEGCDYAGIEMYSGKTTITNFSNNTIKNSNYAAVLSYGTVSGVTATPKITNNTIDGNSYGIDFSEETTTGVTISGNTISNSSADYGFRITYGTSATNLSGNTISNSKTYGINAIANGGSGTLNAMNNVISGSGTKGIRISSFNKINVNLGNGVTYGLNPSIADTQNMGSNTGTNTINLGN